MFFKDNPLLPVLSLVVLEGYRFDLIGSLGLHMGQEGCYPLNSITEPGNPQLRPYYPILLTLSMIVI